MTNSLCGNSAFNIEKGGGITTASSLLYGRLGD